MIAFAVAAVLMAAIAISALVPFLLRRRRMASTAASTRAVYRERLAELEAERERGNLSAADFAEARDELEREVLADADRVAREPQQVDTARAPWIAMAVAILVPAAAAGLYLGTGQPGLVTADNTPSLSRQAIQRYRQMEPAKRIKALEAFVDKNPTAARAWQLLAEAYRSQDQYGDAYSAYDQAAQASRTPDANLLARQAESLFLASGRNFSAGARRLIDQALEVEPRHPLALLLAGHADLAQGNANEAIDHWKTLKSVLPDDDRRRQQVQRLIARAQNPGGGDAARGAASGSTQAGAGDPGGDRITVRVALAPAVTDKAPSDAAVFVFARAPGGERAPLAVARTQVDALPTEIVLSDDQAMTADRTLSQAERARVTARVSTNGGARPQAGDLQGRTRSLELDGDTQAKLTIDQVVGQGSGRADTRADRDQGSGQQTDAGTSERAAGGHVTARVALADQVADSARPDMPVFVFAQKPGGEGPPLAVAKTRVSALPAAIRLSDAEAMVSGQAISDAARVVVTARASSSGGVKPQAGDLEGKSQPVRVGKHASVEVIIDRRLQ
jgi:cytochrome c-type biogenesis protein CcmH